MVSHDIIFEKVYSRLDAELPSYMEYHNKEHAEYVVDKAGLIADQEGCEGAEKKLIKLAALYHDTGFLIGRDNHEEKGCMIARNDLEGYGFSSGDIEKVCGMILSTKIPQMPVTKADKIVADADLFYLGTPLYDEYSHNLYLELQHFIPGLDERKWLEIQINFLKAHQYHTDFCRRELAPMKQKTLGKLMEAEQKPE